MPLNSILSVRTKYYNAWSVDCSWSLAAVVVAVVSFCPSTVAFAVETSVARRPPRQAGVPPTGSRRPRHPAPPRPGLSFSADRTARCRIDIIVLRPVAL